MGRTLHEVFRIREVRGHRTGGTVVALNPPDTGSNRDPEIDVLRLVQPIPGGRDRSSGGWQARRQLHGHKGQLCVRSHRLSALEGPWPDHEPGLHPDEGGRSLRQSNDRPKPALTDRLHLSEGHRLGAGSICPPCSMTSRAISWPGSCASPCRQPTCPKRCRWRCGGSGLNQVKVLHRPRLLSDNGPSYVSSEL